MNPIRAALAFFRFRKPWEKALAGCRHVLLNEPLALRTSFGVGGLAAVFYEPENRQELRAFLKHLPPKAPVFFLGAGSNVLVADRGVPGVVIHIGRQFADIRVEGARLICGAGAPLAKIARVAAQHSIGGFEFLAGIPGTLGGGLRMNAGAFGSALGDRLVSVTRVERAGDEADILSPQAAFGYRQCQMPANGCFVQAVLQGKKVRSAASVLRQMAAYQKKRRAAQPLECRSAGSFFKNPPADSAGRIIDSCGLKGLRIGGAAVSPKHANFIVNTGRASARDICRLGRLVQKKVWQKMKIALEWEVRYWGKE